MSAKEYSPSRLITRIASLFRRNNPQPERETMAGFSYSADVDLYRFSANISAGRVNIYRDIEDMDDVSPEASRALDVLADNAVNSPGGVRRTFTVRFDEGRGVDESTQSLILDMLKRIKIDDIIYTIGRETIMYGDLFEQVQIGESARIMGVVRMPPETMVRNEDNNGRLKTGREKGKWAFEQYGDGGVTFKAGFFPWQIVHLRWNRPGNSKYGRSALHAARYPFKKLQAMEEALVINWLTRAFARLLFELDTTGMSRPEADKYLKSFMDALTSRNVNQDVQGTERLTVAKDLAIGNGYRNMGGKWEKTLNNVSILDTSNTGFWNIAAIEYWRNKLMIATGVPKAHLNIEEDINAKATLQWQDERFARTVRRIQMVLSGFIHHLIDLELILNGIDPDTIDYVVEWPTPSTQDETEKAQALDALATAAEKLLAQGVVDVEYVQAELLGLSPSQRKRIQAAVAQAAATRGDSGGTDSQE